MAFVCLDIINTRWTERMLVGVKLYSNTGICAIPSPIIKSFKRRLNILIIWFSEQSTCEIMYRYNTSSMSVYTGLGEPTASFDKLFQDQNCITSVLTPPSRDHI